ncbi:MAG: DMT family transporter [Albidovulum sp.]|nr:DMT family transporter [Albidovulum sp.]MDE0531346.1 DMT family transporter [Albidovulum sp.]
MWIERQSDRRLSVIVAIAAGVWGLYWLPLRAVESHGVANAWSVALFSACPIAVLIPYFLFFGRNQFRRLREIALIGIFTGTGISFYAIGLVESGVVRATMLFYLTPVWSTLIGYFWLSERFNPGRIAAIVFGLAGLYLLLSERDTELAPLNVGDLFALFSGAAWGLGAACLKKWPEIPVPATACVQFAAAALVSALAAAVIFSDPFPSAQAIILAIPVAFIPAALILLPSVLIIFRVSKLLFPGRVGILMMSEVLVVIFSAWILIPEEKLTAWQWVGACLIISSGLVDVFSTISRRR